MRELLSRTVLPSLAILTVSAAALAASGPDSLRDRVTSDEVEHRISAVLAEPVSQVRVSVAETGLRSLMVEQPVAVLSGATVEDKAHAVAAAVAPLWGLDSEATSELEVQAVRRPHGAPFVHVDLQRRVDGLPVAGYPARVTLTHSGELVAVTGAVAHGRVSSRFDALGADRAVAAAAARIEAGARIGLPQVVTEAETADGAFELQWAGDTAVHTAWRRWVVGSDGDLRLGWKVQYLASDGITLWLVEVDAATGRMMRAEPRTFHDGPTGVVFDQVSPQPSSSPGQVPPEPNPPAIVDRNELSFEGDPVASPIGWVGPDMTSVGNNVIAVEDHDANSGTQGQLAEAVGGRFDFPLELGQGAPPLVDFAPAVITNLFYWTNWAHDAFYHLGFTESTGNFQQDNLGRGGIGGDPLLALAQLGATTGDSRYRNNAWMSTPSDGGSPTMGMYLWGPFAGVETDSSLDADVIIHEYAHGVTGRLGRGWYDVQSGAMNEGNSDFLALTLLLPPGSDPNGIYPVAGYSVQDFVYGIRTRPYSTDETVNSLTYADFGHVISRPEVHADGEIWVQALWEARARLIGAHGEAEGALRIAQLLIDTLMLTPPNPSMLEARDALLLAERARYDGVDQDLLWEAFAERGMGLAALSGDGGSLAVVADQRRPADAEARISVTQTTIIENTPASIWVADRTMKASSVTVTTSNGDSEAIALTTDGELRAASIPTVRAAAAPGDGVAQVGAGEQMTVSYPGADDVVFEVNAVHSVAFSEPGLEAIEGETLMALDTDDDFAFYRLPFDSPFSVIPPLVFVSTNGIISGRPVDNDFFNSPDVLARSTAIAPLWYDLRISGDAQPDEGVYVVEGEGWVRFRWVAETEEVNKSFALQQGQPVNFAVTMYENGRIDFSYGEGNTGFPGGEGRPTTPTVGLGYNDTAVLVPGHDQASDLGNAHTVVFRSPGGLVPSSSRLGLWRGDSTNIDFSLPDEHPELAVAVTSSDPSVVAVETSELEVPAGQGGGTVRVEAMAIGTATVSFDASDEYGAPVLVQVYDLAPTVVAAGHKLVVTGPFTSFDEPAQLQFQTASGVVTVVADSRREGLQSFTVPADIAAGQATITARHGTFLLAARIIDIVSASSASMEVVSVTPSSPAPGQRAMLVVAGVAATDTAADLQATLGEPGSELTVSVRAITQDGGVLLDVPEEATPGIHRLRISSASGAATETQLEVGTEATLPVEIYPLSGGRVVGGSRVTVSGAGGGGLSAVSNRLRVVVNDETIILEPIADTGASVVYRLPSNLLGAVVVSVTPLGDIAGNEVEAGLAVYLNDADARGPALTAVRGTDLGNQQLTVDLAGRPPLGSVDDLRLRLAAGPRVRLLDPTRISSDGSQASFVLPGDIAGGVLAASLQRRDGASFGSPGTVSALVLASDASVSAVALVGGINDTVWRSDMALLNHAATPVDALVTFSDGPSSQVTVPALGQVVVADVVSDLLAQTGAGFLSVSGDGTLVVASRTFNLGANGTYGQPFAGERASASLPTGTPVELIGVSESSSLRTNLGLVNASDVDAVIRVTLRDGNGIALATQDIALAAGRRYQVNRVYDRWAGVTDLETGRITVELVSGERVHAYASMVDQVTGDPTTLLPMRADAFPWDSGDFEAWIAAVAATSGVAGTEWRSDLVVTNPRGVAVSVTVQLVGGAEVEDLVLDLAPGETRRLVDVVGAGGFEVSGNGALRLVADAPVLANARTYNVASEGTYGQLFEAIPASFGLRHDEVGLLPMLAGSDSFRTNIGFVNPGSSVHELALETLDGDGAVVEERNVSIAGGEWLQLGDVVSVDSGWARVRLVTGEGPILVYGSVVDDRTGDPTTIALVR